jgi:6-phosphogluconolactonase (cycloisomerase 2 family)
VTDAAPGDDGASGQPDGAVATAPTVASTSPASNAVIVPLGSLITATFSEAMAPTSLTGGTFTVNAGASAVTGVVTYSGTTATFTPEYPLPGGTTMTARVTTAATDAGGTPLAAEHVWSFTTPFPRFAYVTNTGDDTVSGYRMDPTTGQLIHRGYAVAGDGPFSVAVAPSGRFAYVANVNSGNVTTFAIDPVSGTLSEVGSEVAAGTYPYAVTVDPTGRFAYVANYLSSNVTTFAINPSTGALSEVGSEVAAADGPSAVTVDPTGRFAYVANFFVGNVTTFAINPSTGALSEVGSEVPAGSYPLAVTVDPTGRFAYVANSASDNVTAFAINPSTGALSEVGSEVAAGDSPVAVTVDPTGRFAYVANSGSDNVTTFAINPSTGALSEVGSEVAAGTGSSAVVVDPSGKYASVANTGANEVMTFTIHPATGALTLARVVTARSGPSSIAMTPPAAAPVKVVPRFGFSRGDTLITSYRVASESGTLTAGASVGSGGDYFGGAAVSPGARLLLAVVGSGVLPFRIDDTTGALTEVGVPVAAGGSAEAIAVDISDRFAYATNRYSNDVTTFRVDAATGSLTEAGTEVSTGGTFPEFVVTEPSGRFLYVVNSSSSSLTSFRIDSASGALTQVGSAVTLEMPEMNDYFGVGPSSMVADPTGRFLLVACHGEFAKYDIGNGRLMVFRIHSQTGVPSFEQAHELGEHVASVAVDPLGRFVYTRTREGNVTTYRTDSPLAGSWSVAGAPLAFGADETSDLAADPSGSFVYLTMYDNARVRTFRVDPLAGTLTEIGTGITIPYAYHRFLMLGRFE